MENEFLPITPFRNRHVQSILASSKIRRLLSQPNGTLLTDSSERLLDCGEGVRLQGLHTPTKNGRPARGLVVLLHGWEGCVDSTYMVTTATLLHQADFEVFRLNFRDHGGTQHLNREIFHSCRIDEVVGAVRAVSELYSTRPLYLAGFSLGGNFTLRVALRAPAAEIPLRHAIAISPVINPANALRAMEEAPFFYQQYFIRRWRTSIRRKQECFPNLYDFSEWLKLKKVGEKTAYLAERYTRFDRVEDYFDGYSVAGRRLRALAVPATIITAEDDPIIPVDDVLGIEAPGSLRLRVARYGGHCGFIANPSLESWAEQEILAILAQDVVCPP